MPGNRLNIQLSMLRLRGGLEVEWRPAPLRLTKEWLEATTFDGSPIESRFLSFWDASSCSNETLMHMAAEMGDAAAIARMAQAGIDVNAGNLYGQTPLHKAAMMGHKSLWCLSTLLRCGADVLKQDNGNATALDEARQAQEMGGGPKEAIELLERAEAIARAQREGLPLDAGDEQNSYLVDGNPGLEAVRNAADSILPPSLEDYLAINAQAKLQGRTQEEEAAARERQEEATLPEDTKRKRRSNKQRYKNVKERWAKYKAKKKESKKSG